MLLFLLIDPLPVLFCKKCSCVPLSTYIFKNFVKKWTQLLFLEYTWVIQTVWLRVESGRKWSLGEGQERGIFGGRGGGGPGGC